MLGDSAAVSEQCQLKGSSIAKNFSCPNDWRITKVQVRLHGKEAVKAAQALFGGPPEELSLLILGQFQCQEQESQVKILGVSGQTKYKASLNIQYF